MSLENEIIKTQIDELINLIDKIDPENKIFSKSKKLAENKKIEISKEKYNAKSFR